MFLVQNIAKGVEGVLVAGRGNVEASPGGELHAGRGEVEFDPAFMGVAHPKDIALIWL